MKYLLILTAVAICSPVFAQTFSDGTFSSSDWSLLVIEFGPGGSASAYQESAGGNPGSFRWYTHTVNEPTPTEGSLIHVYHIREDAVWDPSADGPIESVGFSEDRMTEEITSTIMIGGTIALRQNGVFFWSNTAYTIDHGGWQTLSAGGLLSSDFRASVDSTLHPDFTTMGEPIYFGFMRANSRDAGYPGTVTTSGGTDNSSVSVTPSPVAVESASWSQIKRRFR
ncbi:MAG: hypothetical protein ABIJ00_12675 [Candidatus Eisenbacteria bacterium]